MEVLASTPGEYGLLNPFFDGLRPEPILTVTEWATMYRKLGSKGSAEPGPYNPDRTPHLIEIMDCLSMHSGYTKIVVMKAVQLGFTEAGFNLIGYAIDCVPCPIIYIMPTVETMERNVKLRIDPMIEDTPTLKAKIGGKRSKDGGNTMKQKDFNGGAVVMTGANSAAGLRSIAARIIVEDEVDAYPGDVEGEGSPLALVENRAVTFGNKKKIFEISTPTIEGISRIETDFLKTDQRYRFVPCPHCGEYQTLVFENLRWIPGKYRETYYECNYCKGEIRERHKTYMFHKDRAKWIATRPDLADPELAGFHINGLYSPEGWLSWSAIAKKWDDIQGDEPEIKTFINTILALTYKQKTEQPAWERLYDLAQQFGHDANKPGVSVVFITAGVDVQADRLEVELVGWAKGRRSWQVDYRVIDGDFRLQATKDKLGEVLNETWTCEDGAVLNVRKMAIDTGYYTSEVYDFCKKYGGRVIPVKGNEKIQMPFQPPKVVGRTKAGKAVGKVKVWHVGVDYIKSQFYGWLRLDVDRETGAVPNGYCFFTKRDTHYFRGLTAEAIQPVRNKSNQIVYRWIKKYERNEPLDCRVYATAAAYIDGFDRWNDARWVRERPEPPVMAAPEVVIAAATAAKVPKKKKGKKGGYWDRD